MATTTTRHVAPPPARPACPAPRPCPATADQQEFNRRPHRARADALRADRQAEPDRGAQVQLRSAAPPPPSLPAVIAISQPSSYAWSLSRRVTPSSGSWYAPPRSPRRLAPILRRRRQNGAWFESHVTPTAFPSSFEAACTGDQGYGRQQMSAARFGATAPSADDVHRRRSRHQPGQWPPRARLRARIDDRANRAGCARRHRPCRIPAPRPATGLRLDHLPLLAA